MNITKLAMFSKLKDFNRAIFVFPSVIPRNTIRFGRGVVAAANFTFEYDRHIDFFNSFSFHPLKIS